MLPSLLTVQAILRPCFPVRMISHQPGFSAVNDWTSEWSPNLSLANYYFFNSIR